MDGIKRIMIGAIESGVDQNANLIQIWRLHNDRPVHGSRGIRPILSHLIELTVISHALKFSEFLVHLAETLKIVIKIITTLGTFFRI